MFRSSSGAPPRVVARVGAFLAVLAAVGAGGWQAGRLLGPAVLPEPPIVVTYDAPSYTDDHAYLHPETPPGR